MNTFARRDSCRPGVFADEEAIETLVRPVSIADVYRGPGVFADEEAIETGHGDRGRRPRSGVREYSLTKKRLRQTRFNVCQERLMSSGSIR